jgi:hypothetical protein
MDKDQSGMVDIDEFMTFIEIADDLNPENQKSKETAYRIRKANLKLNKQDLFFIFQKMPTSFISSLSAKYLEKERSEYLPSAILEPKFDYKQMKFTDVGKTFDLMNMTSKNFTL